MLKKVRIKNFLSCEDTEFDLEQITLLIGRNAAGKTNVLKAIEWCSPNNLLSLGEIERPKVNCDIEFTLHDKVFNYILKVDDIEKEKPVIESLSYYINDKWELLLKRNNENVTYYKNGNGNFEVRIYDRLMRSILLVPPKDRQEEIVDVFIYLVGIKYYHLEDSVIHRGYNNQSVDYIHSSNYKYWINNNKEKLYIVMILLNLWLENKELLDEIKELVGKNGLDLINNISFEKIVVSKTKKEYFYLISFDINNKSVSYSYLSYGTQRILTLLIALLYDKSTTLLIEQPEDGVHLGLLRKVLSICFEYAEVYNKQLIITTHSPEVINMIQPENIRLVKMTENGTKVSAFDKEEIPFIHDYLENQGALSDFIKSMNED
jgi:AAA15 family ATPase/GTPase